MKLYTILTTSLLALTTIPAFGIKPWPRPAPLWYDLKEDSERSGRLPAELRHELAKYLLSDEQVKSAYNYWYFKCMEKKGCISKTFNAGPLTDFLI